MTQPTPALSLDVDLTLYPIAAVMRAAYKFTAHFHLAIRRSIERPEQFVTVTFSPKALSQTVDEQVLAGDFQNELIDQRVRETLEAEFGPVRELIVAHAFSDTNLLDPARHDGDYLEDSLGIGMSSPKVRTGGES